MNGVCCQVRVTAKDLSVVEMSCTECCVFDAMSRPQHWSGLGPSAAIAPQLKHDHLDGIVKFDVLWYVGNVARMENIRNSYGILIEVPSKYPSGKSWTQKVDINWDFRDTDCEYYWWINLFQGFKQWCGLVLAILLRRSVRRMTTMPYWGYLLSLITVYYTVQVERPDALWFFSF